MPRYPEALKLLTAAFYQAGRMPMLISKGAGASNMRAGRGCGGIPAALMAYACGAEMPKCAHEHLLRSQNKT